MQKSTNPKDDQSIVGDNNREIVAEFAHLDLVAPHWSQAQKRQAVIDTFCFRWSMTEDEVTELVDATKNAKRQMSQLEYDTETANLERLIAEADAGKKDPTKSLAEKIENNRKRNEFREKLRAHKLAYYELVVDRPTCNQVDKVVTLPLERLSLPDDEKARLGHKPIFRLAMQVGGSEGHVYLRDVSLAKGKVRFSEWIRKDGVEVKELPKALEKHFAAEKKELENCARFGWIDVRLVVIDETQFWGDSITARAGKMFCTFFYDAQRVVHLCEFKPSYELHGLYSTPANYIEDDVAREELAADIEQGDDLSVRYMHCDVVERMPPTHQEFWGCIAIDPEEGDSPELGYYKQIDSIREQLQGNVCLQLPSNQLMAA